MGAGWRSRGRRWVFAAARVGFPVVVMGFWCVASFVDADLAGGVDAGVVDPDVELPSVQESPFARGDGPGFGAPPSANPEPFSVQRGDGSVEQSLGGGGGSPESRGSYSFLGEDVEADFVREARFRWDPCTPIRFKTNFDLASDVQARSFYGALATVAEITGLSFVDAGEFDGGHSGFAGVSGFEVADGRSVGAYDAFFGVFTRYEDSVLQDRMALANVTWRSSGDAAEKQWIVHGYAAMMDGPWWEDDFELARQVWLHEIGHLVGLGHVSEKTLIMSPSVLESDSEFGPGDLKGLEAVGSSHGCR